MTTRAGLVTGNALTDDAPEKRKGRAAERFAQHGAEMRFPVVIERIQQILDVHAGFGVTLDAQAAAEEECIRVFAPGGEQPEILHRAADADIDVARRGGLQTPVPDPEMNLARCILDMNAHGFAIYLRESCRDRLAAQQVIEHARQHLGVYRAGNDSQRQKQGVGQHACPGVLRWPSLYQVPMSSDIDLDQIMRAVRRLSRSEEHTSELQS